MRKFYLLSLILFSYQSWAQTLTPVEMKADLSILKSTWAHLHPGLYRYNSPAEIEKYFLEANKEVSRPLAKKQFFLLLSQLNIRLKCGHSFVSYYNQKKLIEDSLFSRAFFPILYRVMGRKLIVTHNLSGQDGITPGCEIRSINGIKAEVIIDSLLTVSKADGRHGMNKKLDNISIHPQDISPNKYSLFDIYFPLFFKKDINDTFFSAVIMNLHSVPALYQFKALTKAGRQAAYNRIYGELPVQEKSWSVRELSHETVLFRLGDFAIYNWKFDFKKYLDSTFSMIQRKGYRNMIIDIRQNEGGADEARDEVLSYLISRRIDCFNRTRRLFRYLSVPDSLLPYLQTWDPDFKKPKPPDQYRLKDNYYESKNDSGRCDTLFPRSKGFRGKVYLITDVTNSSATFIMADNFKKERLGTIVGEETGGTQRGINGGQFFFLYLPHSKIEMDIPLVYQAPPRRRKDLGIIPDYTVRTRPTDLASGTDPQLDFILKKLIPAASQKN